MPTLHQLLARHAASFGRERTAILAPGRAPLSVARLQEHIESTAERLRTLGIGRGDLVASILPDGPDATTALLAVSRRATFAPVNPSASWAEYRHLFIELNPKLLLAHPASKGESHPAREAARSLDIPVADVYRHLEAGVFTIEGRTGLAPASAALAKSDDIALVIHSGKSSVATLVPLPHRAVCAMAASDRPPVEPALDGHVPLVLVSSGMEHRRLVRHLGTDRTVIAISPPGFEHLPPPHTVEHVAAECARALRRFEPKGPYALGGQGGEGIVALEMARYLQGEGEQVAFVALLDACNFFPPATTWTRQILSLVWRKRCHGLPLWRSYRRGARPSASRIASEAFRHYRLHPWDGRVLHIGPANSPAEGCYNSATRGFTFHTVSGDPLAMLSEPTVKQVARILADELDRVIVPQDAVRPS